jgi:hypothetical protein
MPVSQTTVAPRYLITQQLRPTSRPWQKVHIAAVGRDASLPAPSIVTWISSEMRSSPKTPACAEMVTSACIVGVRRRSSSNASSRHDHDDPDARTEEAGPRQPHAVRSLMTATPLRNSPAETTWAPSRSSTRSCSPSNTATNSTARSSAPNSRITASWVRPLPFTSPPF